MTGQHTNSTREGGTAQPAAGQPRRELAGGGFCVSFLDRIAASRGLSTAAIIIVALFCFLPGLTSIDPVDRDEARFAQASRQMLETGDFVDIRFQDQTRYKKPIGIYWLQVTAAEIVGDGAASPIWVYRLPSLLGALAAALLTWWTALALASRRAALLAGLVMAASLLLVVEAHLAKTDAVLLATVLLAHGALARIWLADGDRPYLGLAALFWTAIGLGILVKGPIILLVTGLTVAILMAAGGRRGLARRLAAWRGLAWAAALVAPWFVAITMASGGSFVAESVGGDMLAKVFSVRESHGAPPGTYALLLFISFWPGAAYLALGAPFIRDNGRRPAILFSLAWALPTWIVFELIATKLPHYVLPTYPALAILAATSIDEGAVRVRGWLGHVVGFNIVAVPLGFSIGVPILFYLFEGRLPATAVGVFLCAVIAATLAWWLLAVKGRAATSVVTSLAAAALLYIGMFGIAFPEMTSIRVASRLVEAGRAAVSCSEPEFAVAGLGEPSLVFAAGTRTPLTGGDGAADFLAVGGCRVAFVELRALQTFQSRAEDLGISVEKKGAVSGYNIGRPRPVTLELYVNKDAAP